MSYLEAQNALDATLSGIADLPTIVLENTDRDTCDDYYMRSTLLPARAEITSLGETGWNRFFGLYQVDLFYPVNESSDAANFDADKIIAGFPQKTIIINGSTKLRIVNRWREVKRNVDKKHQVPVFIEWEFYVLRS